MEAAAVSIRPPTTAGPPRPGRGVPGRWPARLALLRVGTALGLLAVAQFFTACTGDFSRHLRENWVINGVPVSQFTDPPPSVKRAVVRNRAAERRAARDGRARTFSCGPTSSGAWGLRVGRSAATKGPAAPTPRPEAVLPSYPWLTVEAPPGPPPTAAEAGSVQAAQGPRAGEPAPAERAWSPPPAVGWTFAIIPCRPAAPPATVRLAAEPHAPTNENPKQTAWEK